MVSLNSFRLRFIIFFIESSGSCHHSFCQLDFSGILAENLSQFV